MLIPNLLKRAQKMFRKKVMGKKLCKFLVFRILHFFLFFFPISFSIHFLSPFRRIWNQHKILRFLITRTNLVILQIIFCLLEFIANFECRYLKNGTFSDISLLIKWALTNKASSHGPHLLLYNFFNWINTEC